MFDISYKFQWASILRTWPAMLEGAWVTVYTAMLSVGLGLLAALILVAMRQSGGKIPSGTARAWVSIARNTPVLLQIYFLYFGLGSVGILISSWSALFVGMTFNNAGYLAEILRSGMMAIPETQTKAARSLGMTAFRTYVDVIIPQVLRKVFHPISNIVISALIMTSFGIIVGLNNDLMGVAKSTADRTYRTFETFLMVAVIYYALAQLVILLSRLIGYRLFRY